MTRQVVAFRATPGISEYVQVSGRFPGSPALPIPGRSGGIRGRRVAWVWHGNRRRRIPARGRRHHERRGTRRVRRRLRAARAAERARNERDDGHGDGVAAAAPSGNGAEAHEGGQRGHHPPPEPEPTQHRREQGEHEGDVLTRQRLSERGVRPAQNGSYGSTGSEYDERPPKGPLAIACGRRCPRCSAESRAHPTTTPTAIDWPGSLPRPFSQAAVRVGIIASRIFNAKSFCNARTSSASRNTSWVM